MEDRANVDGRARPRFWTCIWGMTQKDRLNNRRFVVYSFCWSVVFVAAGAMQKHMDLPGAWRWAVALLPAVPAILAIAAYLRFLREADEMVRTIQFHGLAWGFGAGVLVNIAIQAPYHSGSFNLGSNFGLMAMMLGWTIGQLVAAGKYR